ncbi:MULTISPECIES: SusC/RagA family TonB-linked outer membrane protein [unclassified Arcicella]|uniref:SusC/RagA family TonB-linked outer membrane protein n=1 Tax=unclassified Arcicella TaxID=2644986 RepID=UPI00285ED8F2|nr:MULTISPECIES: SusC/RagA family TonB-linked outer membrane protein [unclassified Arcicella]MDR6562133.1 TonB-linked SusC/RagA family outer membrane protein [Arcicella sp. BE51]MDR6812172.1 TonB-linked SusC/RagA family outer membrane protein [Arcicella sp. BE140]MDR6823484.1 TonB-linked SusC/RagA family outer membrane protein [Arcicella sp. BE139]
MKILDTKKIFYTMLLSLLVNNFIQAQKRTDKSPISTDTIKIFNKSAVKNIAYGIQPITHVTSAMSTVKGEDLEKNFSLNLGNTLYGRLAGLTVTQGGSEPGVSTPNIYVRGINTIGGAGNAPLYIIDGYLSNGSGTANAFMQLLPEEIESISVLKDASATAIYGARAANGVVLVTTKTGNEGPLKISFTARYGFNQAQYIPKFLNSYNYATLYNEALTNDGLAPRYTQADLDAYQNGSDPLFHPNVNWYNEVLRPTSAVSSYDLTFNGGDKFVKYFVVLNAINSQGLFKKFGNMNDESSNSDYSKYNFRTNLNVALSQRLSAEFKIAGAIEESNNPNNYTTASTFSLLSSLPPNAFPIYNPNGTFGGNALYANPVGNLLATGFAKNNTRTILSSLKFTEQLDMITNGLSVSAAVSINNYFESGSRKTKQYPRYSISKGVLGDTLYSPAVGQLTSLSGIEETLDQYRNLMVQAFLNYKKSFGKSDISSMLMFNTDNITFFGPASDPSNPTANSTDPYKHNSGAGRFTYAFDDRYVAEFSFGYMGSDIFAPGKRYGFFPAGSVGWIASNESFLKKSSAINYLKFRGSYGLVGNDIIASQGLSSRYAYTPTFGGGGYFFGTGNTAVGGFAENVIANPNITWEKEKITNVGIDATLFKNLSLSLDVFNRDRDDILVASNSTTPLFLGISTQNLNQGKTNTKGFDLSLRYTSTAKKDLQFFVESNISYYKSKVVFNAEALQLNTQLYSTGRAIGQPIGLKAIGFYSQDDIAQRAIDPKSVPGVLTEVIKAGDIKYQDIGGPDGKPDGIIDGNDRIPIGNPGIPNFTAGLHTGLSYKSFDIDLVFQGVTGTTSYLGGNTFQAFQSNGQVAPIALNRWTPETAATADYPRLSSKDNLNNYQFSTFWQRDGSFVKLRSAEIGYTLPANLSHKVGLTKTRFFVNGTNLFSLDKIEYGDPESLTGYPVTRTLTLGFKIQL